MTPLPLLASSDVISYGTPSQYHFVLFRPFLAAALLSTQMQMPRLPTTMPRLAFETDII